VRHHSLNFIVKSEIWPREIEPIPTSRITFLADRARVNAQNHHALSNADARQQEPATPRKIASSTFTLLPRARKPEPAALFTSLRHKYQVPPRATRRHLTTPLPWQTLQFTR
jgi:hypothetical protein